MFDPDTVALIRRAPSLDGIDLESLPQMLTDAFATVVAARIRLRTGAPDTVGTEIEASMSLLTRLAATHEVLVAQLPDRDNRAAAAFVAGAAHQTRRLARVGAPESSRISATAASAEISAALLFLIAEAYPDAAEASKRITTDAPEATPVERRLISALKALAAGQLREIVAEPLPEMTASISAERAVESLQLRLLRGVRALADQLRRPEDTETQSAARREFLQVKELCIEELSDAFGDERSGYSVFSGPLHLANLLIAADRDMIGAALSHLPAPSGVDAAAWTQIAQRMAQSRPFLWRNHRQAIEQGLLERGRSAVISFPTGGGKSTLAELKIAAALLTGKQVVFLAPTHALISQTAKALQKTFSGNSVFGDVDEGVTLAAIVERREILVTTPERCQVLLAMQPEAFANLGLIVFDECHLLHARTDDRGRRGLDSMLCLLNITLAAPTADLLLMSAMVTNAQELAGWIRELTGRECLALDLAWKPTRQARGCVVYDATRLATLRESMGAARRAKPTQKSVPAQVKRTLTAQPLGFFGLRQTWNSRDSEDYALRALLGTNEPLGTSSGDRWYLTPNGNHVSTAIAAGSVAAGMKTLVFVQNSAACGKCVRTFAEHLTPRVIALNAAETAWRTLLEEEMGGAEFCYLNVDEEGNVRAGAAVHHSLLLREERELHESLFKRRDGIDALFATSTLAQGMNLPSEVVIICGDSRFDPSEDKMKKLEAHELLNAAGRAGRAGEAAQGLVLIVPSRVIEFDEVNSLIGNHWSELQAIFEQSDQCLVIDDPLESALDLIHDGITQSGAGALLLSRLPLSIRDGDRDPGDAILARSFAVFRRRQAGDVSWVSSRISAALAARPVATSEDKQWIGLLAASTGQSVELLDGLLTLLESGALTGNAVPVMNTLLDWIGREPSRLLQMFRPESLDGLFGESYRNMPTGDAKSKMALEMISRLLPLWMSGTPVSEIEAAIRGTSTGVGYCDTARHFVTRVVSDLAFIGGLPARVLLARQAATASGETLELSTVLATLAGIVREGCESPEALAVRLEVGRGTSRVGARRIFTTVTPRILAGRPTESFETTLSRVRRAMQADRTSESALPE